MSFLLVSPNLVVLSLCAAVINSQLACVVLVHIDGSNYSVPQNAPSHGYIDCQSTLREWAPVPVRQRWWKTLNSGQPRQKNTLSSISSAKMKFCTYFFAEWVGVGGGWFLRWVKLCSELQLGAGERPAQSEVPSAQQLCLCSILCI